MKATKRKAQIVMWPGFRGPRHWGRFMLLEFPDNHPDSHCEEEQYIQGSDFSCESCGWIPEDAVCCELHKISMRDAFELTKLIKLIQEAHVDMNMLYYWIAYVERNRIELEASPRLAQVAEWWSNLSAVEKLKQKAGAEEILLKMNVHIIS